MEKNGLNELYDVEFVVVAPDVGLVESDRFAAEGGRTFLQGGYLELSRFRAGFLFTRSRRQHIVFFRFSLVFCIKPKSMWIGLYPGHPTTFPHQGNEPLKNESSEHKLTLTMAHFHDWFCSILLFTSLLFKGRSKV